MPTPKTDASSSRLTGAIAMLSLAVASQGANGITPVATFYVDQRAPHGGNGQSWQTAFFDLQDALTSASRLPLSGDSWRQRLIEIRIAQGTYKPDGANGDRHRCFDAGGHPLTSGHALSLRGSFAGLGSTDPDKQDFISTATILSGDLNGDDGPNWTNRADNSRTILRAETVFHGYMEIEGIEFRGASNMEPDGTDGFYHAYGAALRVSIADIFGTSAGEFFLSHCGFHDNQSQGSDGAGLMLWAASYAIEDCRFERNRTLTGKGGAAWIDSNYYQVTGGRFERSFFSENSAKYGGALFLRTPARIFAGDFRNNSASIFGGAMYTTSGTNLNSVLMVKNSAGVAGGAVFSATSDLLGVSMTTFASNSSPEGAAIQSVSGPIGMYASIVWDSHFDEGSGAIDLGYGVFDSWIFGTIIQGKFDAIAYEPGALLSDETLIDADPLFIRPLADEPNDCAIWNYRVKSGSPAIALAKKMNGFLQDLDGMNYGCQWEPWNFDAGCYFFDSCVCWANLNADWDRIVNDEDFILFADAYNLTIAPPALPRADLNHDGLVDDADFSLFAIAYDAFLCPSPD